MAHISEGTSRLLSHIHLLNINFYIGSTIWDRSIIIIIMCNEYFTASSLNAFSFHLGRLCIDLYVCEANSVVNVLSV